MYNAAFFCTGCESKARKNEKPREVIISREKKEKLIRKKQFLPRDQAGPATAVNLS